MAEKELPVQDYPDPSELFLRLEQLEKVARSQGYELARLQAQAERSDKFKKYLAVFLAGVAYGIILVAIIES